MSCTIEDCLTRSHAQGMCKKHYTRWRTTGDPLKVKVGGPKPKPAAERFWTKVQKTETCWLWTGAWASRWGHGKFMDDEHRNVKAHRWAYEALVGPIPEGLTLDHLCRNPPCVNPAHMEPVTLAENLRRQGAAKTHCPSEHPLSGENLYVDPKTGHRKCRKCRARHDQNRKARQAKARSTGVRTPLR